VSLLLLKVWYRLQQETQGQDLVEYALLAGFVAVAGGAIFPMTVAPNISSIFSKINLYFSQANAVGS
jgi:pilus assembly protein Flp/PilA